MTIPKPAKPVTSRPSHEKSPKESKKFIAWFLSEMTWKVILVVALLVWRDDLTRVGSGGWWLLLSIVMTAGFIGIGFILGQAALDKYVRVAEIAADEIRERASLGTTTTEDPEQTDPKVNT